MNSPLSPVETLQRRIEIEKRLDGGAVCIAALELAKADAELVAHESLPLPAVSYSNTAWAVKNIDLKISVRVARTKLYEVLQK